MVFTKRKTPKFELKLKIDGEDIKEVHQTMFLESSLKISWPGRNIFLIYVAKYQEEFVWLSRPDTILTKMHCITHVYIHILCIAIKFGVIHINQI